MTKVDYISFFATAEGFHNPLNLLCDMLSWTIEDIRVHISL